MKKTLATNVEPDVWNYVQDLAFLVDKSVSSTLAELLNYYIQKYPDIPEQAERKRKLTAEPEALYTKVEARNFLGIGYKKLDELLLNGEIPWMRVGSRCIVMKGSDLADYMRRAKK